MKSGGSAAAACVHGGGCMARGGGPSAPLPHKRRRPPESLRQAPAGGAAQRRGCGARGPPPRLPRPTAAPGHLQEAAQARQEQRRHAAVAQPPPPLAAGAERRAPSGAPSSERRVEARGKAAGAGCRHKSCLRAQQRSDGCQHRRRRATAAHACPPRPVAGRRRAGARSCGALWRHQPLAAGTLVCRPLLLLAPCSRLLLLWCRRGQPTAVPAPTLPTTGQARPPAAGAAPGAAGQLARAGLLRPA